MTYVRSLLCAVLSVLLFAASNASAQECIPFNRAEFDAVTQNAEMQLKDMEKIANVSLDTNILYTVDEQRTLNQMNAYAGNMYRAFQIATAAADQASSTQGAQGDGRLMAEVEGIAARHEPRTIALALKWEKIHAALVQGQIQRASVDLPQGAPDFMQQFNQEGQQLALLDGGMSPEFQKLVARGQQEQQSFGSRCRAAASAIGDLIIPSAQAAQALPCVNPCVKKQWGACGMCVALAGGAVYTAWTDFQKCMSSANTTWGKAWCVAKLIAVIA